MFRAVGKYIDERGLDGIFCRAGIYKPNTLAGILAGKHVKRCVDTYMTLFQHNGYHAGLLPTKEPRAQRGGKNADCKIFIVSGFQI